MDRLLPLHYLTIENVIPNSNNYTSDFLNIVQKIIDDVNYASLLNDNFSKTIIYNCTLPRYDLDEIFRLLKNIKSYDFSVLIIVEHSNIVFELTWNIEPSFLVKICNCFKMKDRE